MLIVIEGLDNSGKNSVVEELCKRYSGFKKLDFPDYSSNLGQLIKEELLSGRLEPLPLQLLFSSERLSKRQLVLDLSTQHIVITTRYSYSAIAYGTARGIQEYLLHELEKSMPKPDMKFFLDITPQESIRRSLEADVLESNFDLLCNVHSIYKHIIQNEKDWIVIDAMKELKIVVDLVEHEILSMSKEFHVDKK